MLVKQPVLISQYYTEITTQQSNNSLILKDLESAELLLQMFSVANLKREWLCYHSVIRHDKIYFKERTTNKMYDNKCFVLDCSLILKCSHVLVFLCQGPKLLQKYRIKSFHMPGRCLETPVDLHLYNAVKTGLIDLLGARSYFGSKVLTPYCYTLGRSGVTVVYLLMFCCSLPMKGFIFFVFRCGDET